MSFATTVFAVDEYARSAASLIASELEGASSLVLTGGTTAERIYPELASSSTDEWGRLEVFFSDERCVPPDDPASNFGMAARLLLQPSGAASVHRMRGEDLPEDAAAAYHEEVSPVASEGGFNLLLLGMGSDCHIAALFPGSQALGAEQLCATVDRPDGMTGLTLTPGALATAKKVLLLVTGAGKADAMARAVTGEEPPHDCPARLLADHPDATFVLDRPAAAHL